MFSEPGGNNLHVIPLQRAAQESCEYKQGDRHDVSEVKEMLWRLQSAKSAAAPGSFIKTLKHALSCN